MVGWTCCSDNRELGSHRDGTSLRSLGVDGEGDKIPPSRVRSPTWLSSLLRPLLRQRKAYRSGMAWCVRRRAQALGIAAASLDCAVKYSLEREAFGEPISKLYAIQVRGVRRLLPSWAVEGWSVFASHDRRCHSPCLLRTLSCTKKLIRLAPSLATDGCFLDFAVTRVGGTAPENRRCVKRFLLIHSFGAVPAVLGKASGSRRCSCRLEVHGSSSTSF